MTVLTAEPDVLIDPPAADHRLTIVTVCLSGTLEDKLAAAAAARFQGVELFDSDLIASSWSPRRVREECARRGLTIDLYQPFRDLEAVPPDVSRPTCAEPRARSTCSHGNSCTPRSSGWNASPPAGTNS